jgi:hypothetical protein
VTRFAKDVTVIDLILTVYMIFVTNGFFRIITVVVTLGIINPWLFIAVGTALAMMIWVMRKTLKPMQDSQRLDGLLRGPIHTTFSMMI